MQRIQGTAAELAVITGFSQAELSVLLRAAEKAGQAEMVGAVRARADGRGRPSIIWSVEPILSISLIKE